MRQVDSRPYRWPYDGPALPARMALLVCTGDAACTPDTLTGERLGALVAAMRAAGATVLWLPSAAATEAPPFDLCEGDIEVRRPRFGGFTGTGLELVLRSRGLTDLVIAGTPLELGADCTMREANDRGYECILIEDCCAGLTPQTYAGVISSAQMSGGIFGAVAGCTDLLKALRD